MILFKAVSALLVFVLLSSASSQNKNYEIIPLKQNMRDSSLEPKDVQEEAVHPEEVYKYGVQEFAIIASDTGFFPSKLIVRKNIPVRLYLTSSSARALCLIVDEFSIKKGVAAQQMEEIRFLPTRSGQYRYYCPVQGIEGSLVVRE